MNDLISLRQFIIAYQAIKELLDLRIERWPAMPVGWSCLGKHLDMLRSKVEAVAKLLNDCDEKMIGPGAKVESLVENVLRLEGYQDTRTLVTRFVDTCFQAKQVAERPSCPKSHLYGYHSDMQERYSLIARSLETMIRSVTADEWRPASEAVQAAEKEGYNITLKWLTRDAEKWGVKLRKKQLPGNHKKEVEWWSLIDYLEKQSPEGLDDETIPHRIQELREQTRTERPLD
jgi:hypothetical protein